MAIKKDKMVQKRPQDPLQKDTFVLKKSDDTSRKVLYGGTQSTPSTNTTAQGDAFSKARDAQANSYSQAPKTNTTAQEDAFSKAPQANAGTQAQAFSHPAYQESENVAAAKAALDAQLTQKPGEFKSQWQSQLDDAIGKILNRESFSYDLNGDALYQQYKDKYVQQGKMAMADTMGQAAAMTGGYGSSYAASVGNQAYQQSLQQLNDVVPELYQMAYDRYNREGQDLYNQYAMLGERENADYARHRDAQADWQNERDYLTGRYDTERANDYSKYSDERNFAYGQHRDAVADSQWNKTFDEGVRQYNEQFQYQQGRDKVADDQWDQTFQYQKDRDTVADQRYDTEWQHQLDREGVEDQRYSEQFQYQKDRDAVADSQWNKTFDEGVRQYNEQFKYQQDRDTVEDQRYDEQFQYQKDRDAVGDSQWQQTFDEGVRQYNEQFKYQQGRDKVEDQKWGKTFQYQQDRDAVEDERYDTQWQHQLEREGIEDQRYDQQWQYQQDRDKVGDDQWQQTFDEGVRQFNEQFEYGKERDKVEDERYNTQWDHQLEREGVEDQRYEESKNSTPQGSKEMWYPTGVQDDNGNLVFRNSDGKTMTFAPGVNPYTGSKNPDAAKGTFGNGYQPNNIGGTPLNETGSEINIDGEWLPAYEANGSLWVWIEGKNQYVKAEPDEEEKEQFSNLKKPLSLTDKLSTMWGK